MLGSFQSVAL